MTRSLLRRVGPWPWLFGPALAWAVAATLGLIWTAREPGAWASIDTGDVQSTLVVSAVVAERRQHVAELRQIVKHLDSARSGAVKDRGASGIVDQLSARRRERTA